MLLLFLDDFLRLLGEERLELALLVVPALAQDGELLLRVFQPLARLLCAVFALFGPLERGVSLPFRLFQLRGTLFSRRVELGAEGGALPVGIVCFRLELLELGLEVLDLGPGLFVRLLRLALCGRKRRLSLVQVSLQRLCSCLCLAAGTRLLLLQLLF